MLATLIATAALFTTALPYAQKDLIFQSTQDVSQATQAFETSAGSELDRFVELSQKGSYAEAYTLWSDLLFRFTSFKLELGKTEQISLSEQVKTSAMEERLRLDKEFQQKLFAHSALLGTFLHNAEEGQKLTPQQRLITEHILKEYQASRTTEAHKIAHALKKISTDDTAAYAYAEGTAKPLNADKLQELKVLTANICCFPGNLTYTYGGVSPWKQRIDKLVEVIRNSDAHIVCLQEVWDPECMRALIESMKNDFGFFVYNAGDPAGTINVNKMGYGSGLFVASKLPLDSIEFHRFPRSIPENSHRGAIVAICRIAKERIAFINTHLNHTSAHLLHQMLEVRQEQLLLTYGYLQKAIAMQLPNKCWGFVAGDFNIDADTTEFKQSGLSSLFSIPYASNPSKEPPTWTDYFNDLVVTPVDKRETVRPVYELVDYCVEPSLSNVKPPVSTQKLVPLFDIKAPTEALSDHQALLTTWKLK